jgi:flagellar P-ring protein precursor FlgI
MQALIKSRQYTAFFIAVCCALIFISSQTSAAPSRIKDIVDIEGIRDNVLVGYGLVVGLNGTGDSLSNAPMTRQSLTAMLERLGVNIKGENINTGNVAAVMVTAKLPPFATQGSSIDVQVSTLGDSTSLQGGTLIVTPLMAADGQVYAVAQGAVMTSGFTIVGDAASVTQNIPTAARIPNGAIVEREIGFDFASLKELRLSLRNPDFTTARRVSKVINRYMKAPIANAENPTSILLKKPEGYKKSIVELITDIEVLEVTPDLPAKIIVDERSGVIVIGENVRISTVAVAQGNLTVRITEEPQVSQPNPLSQTGQTTTVPRTNITYTTQEDAKIAVMPSGVTLQELVTSLNALGVGPRDVITILQAIKAAGAIQAEIEVL